MTCGRSVVAAGFVFGSLAVSEGARAGPAESFAEIVVSPADPNTLVVSYANAGGGVFLSRDAGETWALLCTSAMGLGDTAEWAVDSAGTFYAADFNALVRSNASACGWSTVDAFDGNTVGDMVPDPTRDGRVLAVTSRNGPPNGLFSLGGVGEPEPIGVTEDAMFLRVRVATLPDGALRIYQGVLRPTAGGAYAPGVRVSDDAGESWIEHDHSGVGRSLQLEAIDPSEPNRIFFSASTEASAFVILASDDRGATLRELGEVADFGGLTVSPDGRLWAGSPTDGILVGRADSGVLDPVETEVDPRCLHFDPATDRLYVCGGFHFGWADPTTLEYTRLLELGSAETMHDCGDDPDIAAACEDQLFRGYCKVNHFPDAPVCRASYPDHYADAERDAGEPEDAGVDVDTRPVEDPPGDCGCRAAGTPKGSGVPAWVAALAAFVLALRHSRRRRG